MKHHFKEILRQSLTYVDAHHSERCRCMPPCAFQQLPTRGQVEEGLDNAQVTLITGELSDHLQRILGASFPRSTPFSLLLLHVSQREHVLATAESARPYQYLRLHPPRSFLDQLLMNEGAGIGMALPTPLWREHAH